MISREYSLELENRTLPRITISRSRRDVKREGILLEEISFTTVSRSRVSYETLERYDILQGSRRDLAWGDISHERFRSRRWRSLENTLLRIFSWEYSLEKLSWEISLEAISLLGVSPTVMISRKRRDPVSSRRWRYLVFDVIVFSLKRDSDSIDISLERLQYSLHRIFVRGRGNISLERSRSRLIDRSRGNISHGRSRSRR